MAAAAVASGPSSGFPPLHHDLRSIDLDTPLPKLSATSGHGMTSHLESLIHHHIHTTFDYNAAAWYAQRLLSMSSPTLSLSHAHLLYTCASIYYYQHHMTRVYTCLKSFVTSHATNEDENVMKCKYLYALASFHLQKYTDAESILTPLPSTTSPLLAPILTLLGRICMRTSRRSAAVTHFKKCLEHDSMYWSAYQYLCEMGEPIDTQSLFNVTIQPDMKHLLTTPASSQHDASFIIHHNRAAFVTPAGQTRDAYVTPPSAQQSTTPKGVRRSASITTSNPTSTSTSESNSKTGTPSQTPRMHQRSNSTSVPSTARSTRKVSSRLTYGMEPKRDDDKKQERTTMTEKDRMEKKNVRRSARLTTAPVGASPEKLPRTRLDPTPMRRSTRAPVRGRVSMGAGAETPAQGGAKRATGMAPMKRRPTDMQESDDGDSDSKSNDSRTMSPTDATSPTHSDTPAPTTIHAPAAPQHVAAQSRFVSATPVVMSTLDDTMDTPAQPQFTPAITSNTTTIPFTTPSIPRFQMEEQDENMIQHPNIDISRTMIKTPYKQRIDEDEDEMTSRTQHVHFDDVHELESAATSLSTLLRTLGEAYRLFCIYHCRESLHLISSLPSCHMDSAWVLTLQGRCYFECNDYTSAITSFTRLRSLHPYHMDGMSYYSTALWHMKKEVELSYLAQQLVENEKLCSETWMVVGNCFSLQKEHETALKFFRRAIQLDPYHAYAHTLSAHEYVANDDFDKAMAGYRHAIGVDERHYNAWYGLGNIYFRQEKYSLAAYHFERALRIHPRSSVLYCYLGMVLLATKQYDRAMECLSRADEIEPNNSLAKYQKANVYCAQHKYQLALRELEAVREFAPKEASVHFLLGRVYKKLNDRSQAMSSFLTALDLDPSDRNTVKTAIDKLHSSDDGGIESGSDDELA